MRVVFMGTPSFAVPTLRTLVGNCDVVAVYTRPDGVSGRGSQVRPSPVKEAALEMGLSCRQPKTLRDPAEHEALRRFAPDVIVVAAYGLILPSEILDIPPLGCVNVHASLLPRWRGAAPIQRAILAGDSTTGVSIMRMEEGLDTGPFCARAEVEIDDKSADDLTAELADVGADLLIAALPAIEDGTCRWIEQDSTEITYADKIAKSDVALAPSLPAIEALRRIRASSAQAPARGILGCHAVTVIQGRPSDETVPAGALSPTKTGVAMGFLDAAVEVTRLKPDGKAAMDASAWVRGARLGHDAQWSAL